VLGCSPRACEERLKKLRKAQKLNPPKAGKRKNEEEEEEDEKPMISRRKYVATGDEREYVRTKEGNEIPLDVPLEVAGAPVVGWEEDEDEEDEEDE
jgi:hypothetical protein